MQISDFGTRTKRPTTFLNATKSLIGHGLSAAGTVEVIATLLQMQAGRLHPDQSMTRTILTLLLLLSSEAVAQSLKLIPIAAGLDKPVAIFTWLIRRAERSCRSCNRPRRGGVWSAIPDRRLAIQQSTAKPFVHGFPKTPQFEHAGVHRRHCVGVEKPALFDSSGARH